MLRKLPGIVISRATSAGVEQRRHHDRADQAGLDAAANEDLVACHRRFGGRLGHHTQALHTGLAHRGDDAHHLAVRNRRIGAQVDIAVGLLAQDRLQLGQQLRQR